MNSWFCQLRKETKMNNWKPFFVYKQSYLVKSCLNKAELHFKPKKSCKDRKAMHYLKIVKFKITIFTKGVVKNFFYLVCNFYTQTLLSSQFDYCRFHLDIQILLLSWFPLDSNIPVDRYQILYSHHLIKKNSYILKSFTNV